MLAFWDGAFRQAEDCFTSVRDRGYYFGDGAYDGFSVYGGVCFAMEEHVDRLMRSLAALDIVSPYSKAEIMDILRRSVLASDKKELFLYFQVTRGCADRRHAYADGMRGQFLLFVMDRANYSGYRKSGAALVSVPDDRWRRCDIKSLNLLANVMAAKKASAQGAMDALLVRDGSAAECAAHNVFRVKDGTLYTEPESGLILSGIGRKHVIEIAEAQKIKVVQTHSSLMDYYEADEVFITSCVALVLPISTIDDRRIEGARPISESLYAAYLMKLRAVCGDIDEGLI